MSVSVVVPSVSVVPRGWEGEPLPGRVAAPFVKWAGGKRSLLPKLLPRVPAKIDHYFEPFCGGGALFFALRQRGFSAQVFLNDSNDALMNTYRQVRYAVDPLIAALKLHSRKHSKQALAYYTLVRAEKDLAPVASAARLIYLNKTCFNGLYRVNRAGHFNVPMGDYDDPLICDEVNLQACSAALSKTRLLSVDFELATMAAARGDFVYFDPPYLPIHKESFTKYTHGGFGLPEHERLAAHARVLKKRGVKVMISNSDTPEVRKLYEGFLIEEVRGKRSVGATEDRRGHVSDLLIR